MNVRCCLVLGSLALSLAAARADEPLAIGDRLELFVDDALVGEMSGDAGRRLQIPKPAEMVFTADAPWEGNISAYYNVFQDGDIYRLYYRGGQADVATKKVIGEEVSCYAESRDGLNWTKPELGLREFKGSKANNIIWQGLESHNFAAFRDDNPDCPPEARYKAFGRMKKAGTKWGGLRPFQSADGVTWKPMRDEPVITDGAFDSQNIAFWDSARGEYRAYWRFFADGVRAIRTATSKDFITWENQADLVYAEGTPKQHLYTNAVQPYARAPHIFIGFPTRYLPDEGQRVEPILMSSRDGVHFQRFNEPVVPESAPKDRKGNRSNYMVMGVVRLPGKPNEMSVYATEAYYGPVPGRVRRFVYRLDGFVAAGAPAGKGELVTRPITFSGSQLWLNYAAGKGGSLQVAIENADGTAIDGFGLDDCEVLSGDSVRAPVSWKAGSAALGKLAGRPVRLRFSFDRSEVFSLQFQ